MYVNIGLSLRFENVIGMYDGGKEKKTRLLNSIAILKEREGRVPLRHRDGGNSFERVGPAERGRVHLGAKSFKREERSDTRSFAEVCNMHNSMKNLCA